MPTSFYFGGRKITLPGVYSRIVSGRNNPPLNLDYGTLLIIDNDSLGTLSAEIRGGSGVSGEKNTGKDSIYSFNNIRDFQEFVGQGWWYKAAEFLFRPNGASPGVSTIKVIKPATTTASTLTFNAVGGGTNGGTFQFKTLDESTEANGNVDGDGDLVSGYAYTVESGVIDTNKWIFKVWRGTYTGAYSDTIAYNEVSQSVAKTNPDLLVQSPEFDNIQELIDWAKEDDIFNSYFYLDDANSETTGDGSVDSADVTAVDGFNASTGATATYDKMDETLQAIQDEKYNFVMYTVADEEISAETNIVKIQSHIENDAKFDPILCAYGDDTSLTNSITSSTAFDSDRVILTHGGIKKRSNVASDGFRDWDSFFHMCYQVGRLAGLPPQVPLTFKALDIDGLQDPLTNQEQERALEAGLLCTIYDDDRGLFTVLQGINTLQNNNYTLNSDGTTFVIQLRRIAAQLNAELIINAKQQLLSDPLGVNRNTLSETDVKEWVKGYLQRKVATDTEDDLLISYQNVSVTRNQDAYQVTYEFEPNEEINKLFFTGFML